MRWQIRLTVDFDSAASAPSASASAASTSRSDRPRTQPEITSDSKALVRVTPSPNSRLQKASSVPRSLGRCSSTGPIVDLTVAGGCQPLRWPVRCTASSSWRW